MTAINWDKIKSYIDDEQVWDGPDWAHPFTADEHLRPRPTPTLLAVEGDTRGLFYSDKTNWVYGPADGCKSWLGLQACIDHARFGGLAVYIDAEDTPAEFAYRCFALGATDLLMSGQILYLDDDQIDEAGNLLAQVALHCMGEDLFVVVDSATETGAGQDLDSITAWKDKYLKAGWPPNTGFLVIDHMPKEAESQLRNPELEIVPTGPFGSQNKKALLRGALWLAMEGPEGAWTKSETGSVRLMCQKDKPGGGFKKGVWSTKVTGTPASGELTLKPTLASAMDAAGATVMKARILDAVRADPGINRTGVQKALKISPNGYATMVKQLGELVAEHKLVQKQEGKAYRYKIKEAQS
ncbi:MAG: hypothetical protein F4103_10760 [Boseongicola sp. SB0673_bin_14]|nr:hypothetical protein [Boseongicola sp. SB0673_bin_14]